MLKKASLIVVDDLRSVAESLAASLQSRFDVSIATSGIQAIRCAKVRTPFAAIIDINLETGISGIETARQIRRISPETILLLFSAIARNDEEIQRVKAEIRAEFLEKPVDPQFLIEFLSKKAV